MLMFVAALTGCEQKILFDDDKNEHIYQLPENGYIFFNPALSTNTDTRGTLVTDMKRSFGVMGYHWENIDQNDVWSTMEPKAKPDVFYNQKIVFDENLNLHTYTPEKEWNAGYLYSFFAYYPYNDNNSITISSNNNEGTPYLTYKLPTNPVNMVDIMTAAVYNTDYKNNSGYVNFHFKHRLSAIDLQMLNLNDEFDPDANSNTDNSTPVRIEVYDMKIMFTNLRYNKVILSMNEAITDNATAEGPVEQNYTLFSNPLILEPIQTGATSENITYTTSGNPLIIIPQKKDDGATEEIYRDYLKGKLQFSIKYYDKNDNDITNQITHEGNNRTIDFNIGRDVLAGRRYTLQLTFTLNATTIEIVRSGDWIDYKSIIEFD